MTVQTDYRVRRRHDHMKIVRDHQNSATAPVAVFADQPVKRFLTGEIDALNGFVEHQQIGLSRKGARQHHALKLSSGKIVHFSGGQMEYSGFFQSLRYGVVGYGSGQMHEPANSQWQTAVNRQFLRDIANCGSQIAFHASFIRLQQAERGTYRGGFAGSVRTDQRDDLSRSNSQIHTAYQPATVSVHPQV